MCASVRAHMRTRIQCKEALASRGCLKRKVPAGFIVDWAVVEGELPRVGVELNYFKIIFVANLEGGNLPG